MENLFEGNAGSGNCRSGCVSGPALNLSCKSEELKYASIVTLYADSKPKPTE